jgi:hypothetical protein
MSVKPLGLLRKRKCFASYLTKYDAVNSRAGAEFIARHYMEMKSKIHVPADLSPQELDPEYSLDLRLSGSQNQFGRCRIPRITFVCRGTEPKSFGSPARLSYTGSTSYVVGDITTKRSEKMRPV